MEEKLANWFALKRKDKMAISMKMIKEEAKKVFQELKDEYRVTHKETLKKYETEDFKCSSDWFQRYRKANKIFKRMPTHSASSLSENYANEIAKFIGSVRELK